MGRQVCKIESGQLGYTVSELQNLLLAGKAGVLSMGGDLLIERFLVRIPHRILNRKFSHSFTGKRILLLLFEKIKYAKQRPEMNFYNTTVERVRLNLNSPQRQRTLLKE